MLPYVETRRCFALPRRCREGNFEIPASQNLFWLEEVGSGEFVIVSQSVIDKIPESDRISVADSSCQPEFAVYDVAGTLMPSGEFWLPCEEATKKGQMVFRLTAEMVQVHLPNSFRIFQEP